MDKVPIQCVFPVHLAPKKNSQWQLVVNMRTGSESVVTECYHLSTVEELLPGSLCIVYFTRNWAISDRPRNL
jgi:hypothetical protein